MGDWRFVDQVIYIPRKTLDKDGGRRKLLGERRRFRNWLGQYKDGIFGIGIGNTSKSKPDSRGENMRKAFLKRDYKAGRWPRNGEEFSRLGEFQWAPEGEKIF